MLQIKHGQRKQMKKSIRSDKVKIIFYSTSTHTYIIVYLQRRKDGPLEMFLNFKSREKRQIDLIILTNFFAFKVAIDKLEVAFGHMPNLSPKDSYHIRLIINSICNLTNRCPTRCRSSNYLLCQTFNHVFCQLNIDENCKARRNVLIANLIPPKFYMCKQTTSKAA